jgi:uncharacterized protein YhbP (UPF0306 family)
LSWQLSDKENVSVCTVVKENMTLLYKKYVYGFGKQKAERKLVNEDLSSVHTREDKLVKENSSVAGLIIELYSV